MDTFNIFLCTSFLVLQCFGATLNSTVSQQHAISKGPISVASEGGSITSNNSNSQLNDYLTKLMNVDSGLDKSNKSSIVPRKKADFKEGVKDTSSKSSTALNNATKTLNASLTNSTALKKESVAITPKAVHKPTVLSYEALAQTDERNHVIITENEPSIKVQKLSSNSHPGMVMPIVITILVVPMFAVVGYMALKRGKEAWKNRHYKRMDFLLDGMYNE